MYFAINMHKYRRGDRLEIELHLYIARYYSVYHHFSILLSIFPGYLLLLTEKFFCFGVRLSRFGVPPICPINTVLWSLILRIPCFCQIISQTGRVGWNVHCVVYCRNHRIFAILIVVLSLASILLQNKVNRIIDIHISGAYVSITVPYRSSERK